VIRNEQVECGHGDADREDREDGERGGEDEVLLGEAEFLDVPVGELEDDGDEREEKKEEKDERLVIGVLFSWRSLRAESLSRFPG
jgi:hypothetical protein